MNKLVVCVADYPRDWLSCMDVSTYSHKYWSLEGMWGRQRPLNPLHAFSLSRCVVPNTLQCEGVSGKSANSQQRNSLVQGQTACNEGAAGAKPCKQTTKSIKATNKTTLCPASSSGERPALILQGSLGSHPGLPAPWPLKMIQVRQMHNVS